MSRSMHVGILIAYGLLASTAAAMDGVSDTEIIVGQCAALKGPAAGLGIGMKSGIETFFAACNEKGGVHGRKLKLISRDDSYDPDKTVDSTLKLIDEDKVFSLIGYVGTPTTKVAIPIVEERKVPLVGVFSGGMILRDPVSPHIVNIRASYVDETEALIAHLLDDPAIRKIAAFYQDDSFGLAGLAGVKKALKKRNLTVAAEGKFVRNTLAVKTGLSVIMQAQPDAVIMVGTYQPIAAFMKAARESNFSPMFATLSFVGTENLIKELGPLSENMLISQVVPPPDDVSYPVVAEYVEALKKYHPGVEPSFAALEGFLTAKIFTLALQQVGRDVSRESLLAAVETMNEVDVGGLTLRFSAKDHQGLDDVFLTRVTGQKAAAIHSHQAQTK